MTRYIVKPDWYEDFYVEWSSVVDGPTAFGTREELTAMLPEASADRFERADAAGTSAMANVAGLYGWEHGVFVAQEPLPAPRRLLRSNMRAYVEALAHPCDLDAAIALTDPFEEDPAW